MSDLSTKQASRRYLWAAIALVALFFINLINGKLSLMSQTEPYLHLEGVPEFILLLLAVACFVISALLSKAALNPTEDRKQKV